MDKNITWMPCELIVHLNSENKSEHLSQHILWNEIYRSYKTYTINHITTNWILIVSPTQWDDQVWSLYLSMPLGENKVLVSPFSAPLIFATKFSSIYLAKGEKRFFYRISFVNLQRAKDGTHVFDVEYRYLFIVWISLNRTLGIIPHQLPFQMNVFRVTRKCY